MILILIPMAPNMPGQLRGESLMMIQRMQRPDIQIVVDSRGDGDAGITSFKDRVQHMCGVRNGLIKDYLWSHHTHVLWMDSDLIGYDEGLPYRLRDIAGSSNVAAPGCYLSGFGNRWYDLAGFIEEGKPAEMYPPHFKQPGPLVELDSVGCCYMVPADVYRQGAVYCQTDLKFAEHYSVCQKARELGLKVLCDMRISVFHADLTKYGLVEH